MWVIYNYVFSCCVLIFHTRGQVQIIPLDKSEDDVPHRLSEYHIELLPPRIAMCHGLSCVLICLRRELFHDFGHEKTVMC